MASHHVFSENDKWGTSGQATINGRGRCVNTSNKMVFLQKELYVRASFGKVFNIKKKGLLFVHYIDTTS